MKTAVKAALLSGLVFPGLGQLWLKRPVRGLALLAASCTALAAMVVSIGTRALTILEHAETAEGTVDMLRVVQAAQSATSRDTLMIAAWLVLSLSWAISVVDAFRIGEAMDREKQAEGNPAPDKRGR
jgi:TM2 domain-containing membrane protein YozV